MPTLEFETLIDGPLEKVWEWHQDVRRALAVLGEGGRGMVVESVDEPLGVGARVVFRMKGPMGREVRWVARFTEFVPPKAVVFGAEARWTDEQEAGPFAYWRHQHEFEAIDDTHTRLVDRVTYRMPWGPIGWVVDWVYLRREIGREFRRRHEVLGRVFTRG